MTNFSKVKADINATLRRLVAQVDEDILCVANTEAKYAQVASTLDTLIDELSKTGE